MNVLVDTSVWVSHFKQRSEHLVMLLDAGAVMCHPHVVIEIACGTPPRRHDVITMLGALETVSVATNEEVLALIGRHKLYGQGCGFVDLSLLASALVSEHHVRLWTLDKKLETVAQKLGVMYRPALQ
jgi:predicted nucleic acid-binding protein